MNVKPKEIDKEIPRFNNNFVYSFEWTTNNLKCKMQR